MNSLITKCLLCLTMCLVSSSFFSEANGSSFDEDLRRLRDIRNGKQTDFKAAEIIGKELLDKHTAEGDLGIIYYELSCIYAQSGLVHRDRVVKNADEALELLNVPELRLFLYIYKGDAIRGDKAIQKQEERRTRALESYLTGLAEIQELDLPEEPFSEPSVYKLEDLKKMLQDNPEEYTKLQEARLRNFNRNKLQKKLHVLRDILIKQSASLYHKSSGGDSDELESAMKLAGINLDNADSIRQDIKTYRREHPP